MPLDHQKMIAQATENEKDKIEFPKQLAFLGWVS